MIGHEKANSQGTPILPRRSAFRQWEAHKPSDGIFEQKLAKKAKKALGDAGDASFPSLLTLLPSVQNQSCASVRRNDPRSRGILRP
jgi:hypothetical protein